MGQPEPRQTTNEARREIDLATLTAVASAYVAGGWPAEVDGDAITAPYSAQSAGPGPWYLFRFRIATVFGVGLRPPHGASRWDFSEGRPCAGRRGPRS